MGSIYRSLSAFARNYERCAYARPIGRDSHMRMSRPLQNDLKLCVWEIKPAATHGISFQQFLKHTDISDVTLYTDASLLTGAEGTSNEGHWFRINWKDIQFYKADNRDIVWRELAAIYIFLDSLKHSLRNKTVHIYTDNQDCKKCKVFCNR